MFKDIKIKPFNSILKMLKPYAYVEMNHNVIVRKNMLTVMRIYWNTYQSSAEIRWQATSYYVV